MRFCVSLTSARLNEIDTPTSRDFANLLSKRLPMSIYIYSVDVNTDRWKSTQYASSYV